MQDTNTSNKDIMSDENKVLIYPSPSNDIIKLFTPFSFYNETRINFLDFTGRLVFNQLYSADQEIDIQTLKPGIYLLSIISKNEKALDSFIKL